jgi:hypothetical protein
MRIKADFVTNSSSTAYIIYLPDWFDILGVCKEEHPGMFDDEQEPYLKKVFELLKSQPECFLDSDVFDDLDPADIDSTGYELFNTTEEILRKFELLVGGIDMGPDNYPTYFNIACMQIQDKIKAIKSKIGDI